MYARFKDYEVTVILGNDVNRLDEDKKSLDILQDLALY